MGLILTEAENETFKEAVRFEKEKREKFEAEKAEAEQQKAPE